MKIQCPRCEEGWINKALVRKTNKHIFICPECDAVWFCLDSIEYCTFNYFNYYMERQGLLDEWSELEIIEIYNK